MPTLNIRYADLIKHLDVSAFFLARTASPWAVLLCKFSDDTTPTVPLEHYQRLFTSAGNGSLNMVDFFSDMSHGQLDLGSSQVLGWYTLPITRSDYAGNVAMPPVGKVNRNGLVDLCRTTASNSGVDLTGFAGVVVSMNGAVDLFGYVGGMAAFCDSLSLQPSLLGQEMGHGYGLDHARRDGSTEDYQDPWDVMSTATAYMANNSEWDNVGPGLNAWSMRARGWLDESRVWKPATLAYDATIQLRPLHQHSLPGYLALELGQFLVEFRVRERWDAAIPRSAVFVHRFDDNHSYVMAGADGSYDLVPGDSFNEGSEGFPFTPYAKLDVLSIDEGSQTATVHCGFRPASRNRYELVGRVFGGVAVDGGGFLVIGGKVVPVPPRGPVMKVLEQLAAYLGTEQIEDVGARSAARQAILSTIAGDALLRLAELQPIRVPAQPDRERFESRDSQRGD